MTETLILLAAIIVGGLMLAIAMRMAFHAGQQVEELRGRRYLDTLSHLQRSSDPE